jgi:hypothetical protein
MAKLNALGDVCGGIGGGVVSAGGVVYAQPGGGTCWLDDDTILYQCYRPEYEPLVAGGWALEKTNIRTAIREMVVARGANKIYAGAGRYEAWLGGYGCYGTIVDATAGVVGAARDGTLALVPDAATGLGLTLYGPAATTTQGPGDRVEQYGLCVLGPTSALWLGPSNAFEVLNGTLPDQIGAAWNPVSILVGADRWIAYWCDEYGYVLHPYDSLEGYVVESSPHVFWPDAVAVSGLIRVAFAWNQGEQPSEIIVRDFNLSATRTTFTRSTTWIAPAASTRTFTGDTTGGAGHGYPPLRDPIVRPPSGMVERSWATWFQDLSSAMTSATRAQTTGAVDRSRLPSQPASTLLGRGSQMAGPPEVIRLGVGLVMQDTILSVIPQELGYYEPLTDGDLTEPELIFADGEVVMAWRAL